MGWFKKKGWDALSQADKAWAKDGRPFEEHLKDAIENDNATRFNFLLINNKWPRERRIETHLSAVQAGAVKILNILFKKFNFDSGGSSQEDAALVGAMFRAAAVKKNIGIWEAIYKKNLEGRYGAIDKHAVLNIALQQGFLESIGFTLENERVTDNSLMRTAILSTVEDGSGMLEYVLSYVAKFKDMQSTLDDAIVLAARSDLLENAKLLMGCGANPNAKNCLPFVWAAENDNRMFADLLINSGGSLVEHGENVLKLLRERNARMPGLVWMEELVNSHKQASQAKKAVDEKFVLVDPESYTETQYLPHGLRLTTLFNFSKKQQVSITEKIETGQITMAVKDFAEIRDPAIIEAARGKLRELGGTPPAEGLTIQKSSPRLKSL